MNIALTPPTQTQKKVPLKSIGKAGTFHYACDTLQEAITENRIWMRVDAPEVKGPRVRVVNLATGEQNERDDDHPVVQLNITIQIQNPE